MSEVKWTCPDCGHKNEDPLEYAEVYTCECENCGGEFEVLTEVEIEITAINKVGK